MLGVALAVWWVYRPVLGATAIWLDDQQYVVDNQLVLNPSAATATRFVAEVLRPSTVAGYYQPLTMISLMLDSATGGSADNLLPFHRTNLLLHIVATLLVVVLLIALFDEPYPAALVGLLFGLHPLTVEPVAWMSERKTLLATCFALAALVAYVRYAKGRRGASPRDRSRYWYAATVACYLGAVLSKPTTTTLPMLFLVLDYWPLARLDRRSLIEKIPLFVVGGISVLVATLSQQNTAVIQYPTAQSWTATMLLVSYNVAFYLAKILYPADLLGFYLRPDHYGMATISLANPMFTGGVVATALIVLATAVTLRWTRAVASGVLFYLIALLPAVGVVRVATVMVSEKYAYFPALGVVLILGWLLALAWSRSGRTVRVALGVGMLALAAAEASATRRYLAVWQDNDSLYGYVHAHSPHVRLLQSNLGDMLARDGDFEKAVLHYRQAEAAERLAGVPPQASLQNNLANALTALGRMEEAIPHYYLALKMDPSDVDTMNNLALVLEESGREEEAADVRRRARGLRASP